MSQVGCRSCHAVDHDPSVRPTHGTVRHQVVPDQTLMIQSPALIRLHSPGLVVLIRGRRSKRSHAPFTDEHLKRVATIALEDQEGLFERNPHLDKAYRNRLFLIALYQGGAQHFVDCKKGLKHTNGMKDLDVNSFYAEHPGCSPAGTRI